MCFGNALLRSEIPSGMCAKLRTVAASNNRDHARNLSYYCLLAPHICMVLFFTHIPFVVNHTINATQPERLQQHYSWCDDLYMGTKIRLLFGGYLSRNEIRTRHGEIIIDYSF